MRHGGGKLGYLYNYNDKPRFTGCETYQLGSRYNTASSQDATEKEAQLPHCVGKSYLG